MTVDRRIGLLLLTGAVAGTAAGFTVVWALRRVPGGTSPKSEEVSWQMVRLSGVIPDMDREAALARVTLVALDNPNFREAWETAVRRSADQLTGYIAGARMRGIEEGQIQWDANVPVPTTLHSDEVRTAFKWAVMGEVNRRVTAMTGKGGPG